MPQSKEAIESEKLSPPLKWAGGKRWLVPLLLELYRGHRNRRLVEPFVGGMSVALGLNPQTALLNDTNPHLINFYRHLKKKLVLQAIMKNERAFFFKMRERFNNLITKGQKDSLETASLFYYLNRTSYNGLCRFNNKGEFNVPFGSYKTVNYRIDLTEYASVMRCWKFTCGDFERMQIDRKDLLYVDPPYDVDFTKYSKEDFKWEDQERLVTWLNQHKGPIIASNQATSRILKLYKKAGFKTRLLSAPRRISCTGDRKPTLEGLFTKNI